MFNGKGDTSFIISVMSCGW